MRLRYSALLAAVIAFSSHATFASELNAGTIHFTGEIIDPSCEIAGDPGHDMTVPLGTYPTSLFTQIGAESTRTAFIIALDNCPLTTDGLPQIQLTFTGSSAVTKSTTLLDVTGGATNVGIAISKFSAPTVLLDLDGTEDQVKINLPTTLGSRISETFLARYQSFAEGVTAGPANANLTVNILYR